jgi:hypothetical protein
MTLNLTSPLKEAEELFFVFPKQIPQVVRAYCLRTLTGVSFKSPSKISAPPRSQSIATCRIPQKSKFFAHIDVTAENTCANKYYIRNR